MKTYIVIRDVNVMGVHLLQGDMIVFNPENDASSVCYRNGVLIHSVKKSANMVNGLVNSGIISQWTEPKGAASLSESARPIVTEIGVNISAFNPVADERLAMSSKSEAVPVSESMTASVHEGPISPQLAHEGPISPQ